MSDEVLVQEHKVGVVQTVEVAGIDKLATALAKAQAKFKNPEKNRTVTVNHKAGGSHKYSYATLDAVLDCVRGPLTENGLAFVQIVTIKDDDMVLASRLIHESGQSITSVVLLPKGLGIQEMGSAITYWRRYAACPMLGVCGETDTDAEEVEEKEKLFDEVKQAEAVERLKELAKKGKIVSAETGKPVQSKDIKVGPPQQAAPIIEKPKEVVKAKEPEDDIPMDFPKIDAGLAAAMKKDGVTLEQFKAWGVGKGNFPATIEMDKLNPTFVAAVLKNWAKVVAAIKGGK